MFRRGALTFVRRQGQLACYTTEAPKPPPSSGKPEPQPQTPPATSTPKAPEKKPEPTPSATTKPVSAATPTPTPQAAASEPKATPVSPSSASTPPQPPKSTVPSMVPKAFQKAAPPHPPAAESKPEASKPAKKSEAAPPSTNTSASPSATSEDIAKLLDKQHQLLMRMAQDIEVARGERAKQVTVNGDTPLRAIPVVLSEQAKAKSNLLGEKAKSSLGSLQKNLTIKSYEAVDSAIGARKLLSDMNRAQQLPWQKDSPKEMYTKVGKWFLSQQQGTEAPVYMTAFECSVVLAVIMFWVFASKRATSKARAVQKFLDDTTADADNTIQSLKTAVKTVGESVAKKNDEVQDVLSLSNEQSVTVDALARSIHDAVAK